MSTKWIIGGVTVHNFFITRASFVILEKSDVIHSTKFEDFEVENRHLISIGLMPIVHMRHIMYHRARDNNIMLMVLYTNADDSFGFMQYDGRVPGDRKFYYLFDGKKHHTDQHRNPRNHRLFDKRQEFVPYLIHEWHAKQQKLYRDLQERHRMNTTGSLCRISHDVLKNYIMHYLIE